VIITLAHVRTVPNKPKAGFCTRGARAWFSGYGLDFDTFRTVGIDSDVILATGDPFAIRLVAHAKEQADGQQ
jgi:hypothetical protein